MDESQTEETTMAKKAKIDKDACIGCGLCIGTHPDLFGFDADGKADAIAEGEEADIADAAENCPVQAISEE